MLAIASLAGLPVITPGRLSTSPCQSREQVGAVTWGYRRVLLRLSLGFRQC